MASVRKHGNRSLVSWYDLSGKKRYQTFTVASDANKFARKVEREKDLGRDVDAIVDGAMWAALVEAHRLECGGVATYAASYEGLIRNHLTPVLGDLRIRDIDSARVGAIRESLVADGYSIAQQRHVLGLLKRMLAVGIATRPPLVAASQVPDIALPSVPEADTLHFIETDAAIVRFLDAARAHRMGELLHPLYAVAVYTGLRAGEVRALRLDDVTLDRRQIKVARQGEGATTKGKRIRHVPICAPLLPILSAHLAERVASGAQPDDFVFQSATGVQIERTAGALCSSAKGKRKVNQGAYFAEVRDAAGLSPGMTFHDLRHTYASHAAMAGRSQLWIQINLGHASEKTTRIYTHLNPVMHGGGMHTCMMHPAEVPEVAAAPVRMGPPSFLEWVAAFTLVNGREPSQAEMVARMGAV